ncbi:polymeric immunoglobulin receptor isoform X1 [Embiotoca jacksoni]|uniref:polymeric immunoglobulin receptor isoform X1 n=1 Tax=Embiotoca jacksoni TaxID=100190 RepID=UPI00370426EF
MSLKRLVFLTVSLFPWIPACLCNVTTLEEFAELEGRSLSIPCHYEPKYASNVKYWCRGWTREFCSILARTDDPRSINRADGKVSIFDDPAQQMFTVTMNDLKEGESGWYTCGVEVGGIFERDDVAITRIKAIHGMSVVSRSVRGEEGGSVTVECLYSERYRESEKKWCRSGDWSSCLLTGSDGSFEDTSVAISDDRTWAFTVTLKKLQMRDSGWYLCCAGQKQMSVYVLVTPRSTTATTAASVTSPPPQDQAVVHPPLPKAITNESWDSQSPLLESMVGCFCVVLLVFLVLLAKKFWRLHKREPVLRQVQEAKARFKESSWDVGDQQNFAFLHSDGQDLQKH